MGVKYRKYKIYKDRFGVYYLLLKNKEIYLAKSYSTIKNYADYLHFCENIWR